MFEDAVQNAVLLGLIAAGARQAQQGQPAPAGPPPLAIVANGHYLVDSRGERREVAVVRSCRADGMAVNRDGNFWLTCYSFGMAHLLTPDGVTRQTISVEQKALTNIVFGRAGAERTVYLTSSDMDRETGYVYRAEVEAPGLRD